MPSPSRSKLVSVVAPVFNEEEGIGEFHRRVSHAMGAFEHEILLVNDGSSDQTAARLAELAQADSNVRVVTLSRNFGHQAALTAGLELARGDAIVTIDADLQDPPEVIPELIQSWTDGADVVHAVRRARPGEPPVRLALIKVFYWLLGKIGDLRAYPGNSGDFRLLSRRAADALNALPERSRFLRGLVTWVGFNQEVVYYDREERFAGKSKYPYRKLAQLAIDGVLSFSVVPLRIASLLGLLVSATAALAVPLVVLLRMAGLYHLTGIASIHILILTLGGMQLVCLGVIGEYIGRLYDEAKQRPVYILMDE
ncbi:MAG: glycosyltransferase family 2 protein [Actinobacteria bacterium]|nr:glycosyltransferase family 2 protein [Actinomycetota bacterium]